VSRALRLLHAGISAVILGGLMSCSAIDDTAGVVSTGDGGPCAAGVPLEHRPEGEAVNLVDGVVESTSDTVWPLVRQGQYVTLRGQGYLRINWQIEYVQKAGLITPPTFTLMSGAWLYVGGGGGYNLGDPQPETTGTWLGNAEEGLSYLPPGVPIPWHGEFYYLDGEVTVAIQETDGLYNLFVSPQTYDQVVAPGTGVYGPGVVCDPA
jgi:hypothetical protein